MFKRPIVVNLIAAPGTGKSTIAAGIFEKLKWNNVNAELVTEFAKDKVWEENPAPFKDGGQLYLLGKQFYRMHRCRDNVDVIVTDSPLCLASYYLRQIHDPQVITDVKSFDNIVKNLIDSFDNMNFFLNRKKKYNPKGRFQTEEESDKIAAELWDFFTDNKDCNYTVSMEKLDGTAETRDLIVEKVLKKLGVPEEVVEKKDTGCAHVGVEEPRDVTHGPLGDMKLGSLTPEFFKNITSIEVVQLIYVLRSIEASRYLKPLSMRITSFIYHDDELTKILDKYQWPMTADSGFAKFLAKTFNVMIPIDDINKCRTVNDLAEYISALCKIQHKS